MPENAAIIQSSPTAPLWIATTNHSDPAKRARLHRPPYVEVLMCPGDSQGQVDLSALMTQLAQRHVTSVLSEAGGRLTAALLNHALADRVAFFYAPKLIGGTGAPGMLDLPSAELLDRVPHLTDIQIRPIGPDLLVEGHIRHDNP
jgi:diaminohydroxyphosphoribosylaminopyrimidine deaminase/5-amino-6-(5-phosphoribosylamino)uracil reductase